MTFPRSAEYQAQFKAELESMTDAELFQKNKETIYWEARCPWHDGFADDNDAVYQEWKRRKGNTEDYCVAHDMVTLRETGVDTGHKHEKKDYHV